MKKLIPFLVLLALPAFAQTPSRVDGTFQDALGRALSGATVYVCTQPCVSTSIPPSPLATLFSDGVSTPVTTAGQVSTDGNGNFFFYTLAPIFTEVFVYRGRIVKILPDQVPKGGGAGFNCGSPLAPGILYFNGTACVVDTNATDDTNLAGNIVVASLTTPGTVTATNFVTTGSGGIFGGTQQSAPAAPLTNQYALYVDSTSGKLTCLLGPSATNCMPAGGGGAITISTNSVNNTSQTVLNFVNPATFNGLTFTYSNPTTGNETFTLGGTLGNAGLTNSATTVNGVTCTLGSTCTIPAGGSGILNSQGPLTAVTGTGAAANLYTFSIPGGTMSTTSCVRATVYWQHTTGSSSVVYIWSFGGTTFSAPTTSALAISQSSAIVCNNTATNSQWVAAFAGYATGGTFIVPVLGTAAIDTTTSQSISFQFTVAATDAVTPKGFLVENLH